MKCSKCGYDNLKGVKYCGKCKTKLDTGKKSCPRCAYRNDSENHKCIKCGFIFDKNNKKTIIFNFFISFIIVLLMFTLLLLEKDTLVSQMQFVFKIIALLVVIYIFFSTISFSKKNEIKLKDDVYSNAYIKRLEIISKILLILLIIVLLCLSIYLYFKYVR